MALTTSAAFARRLSASDPRWLRPSFLLTRDVWTPGQRGREAAILAYAARSRWDRTWCDGAQALRYAHAREAAVPAARSRARAHVRVRPDGLRLRPYRQLAPGHRLRRLVPPAAPPLRRRSRHLRAQHHRRRRQDHRARRRGISRPAAERGDSPPDRDNRPAVSRGRGRARLPAAHGRAARDRTYRGDEDADRASCRPRLRLRRRGARAVQRALDAGLRQAFQALARRVDRGRARRGRALQTRSQGFRTMEALEGGRAGVALALRHRLARAPGL